MSEKDLNATRRKVLGGMASAGALLGIGASAAPASAAEPAADAADRLLAPAKLRSYKARRSSSWDRSGGNGDSVPVEVGQTATILDLKGSGVVTHLWFTIASDDQHHLKNLVLRAWWDGESSPSIEAPIGDFFGLGLGEYFTYQSALLTVAPVKALNSYFAMPFASGAKITVTNEGKKKTNALYFAADYVTLPSIPDDVGRFHAQYRQAAPCKPWTNNWGNEYGDDVNGKKNLTGEGNYVYLEASGRGHFVGVTHAIEQNQEFWFGEGDDMIFIDGEPLPSLHGTGTEDYFCAAFGYPGGQASMPYHGISLAGPTEGPEAYSGKWTMYRFHVEDPIQFQKSLRVTIEHGHANVHADDYSSVAYWYQAEPHDPFPPLAPVEMRLPISDADSLRQFWKTR
jgi:hypothetical protein